ncbi:MAG: hypothetical protein QGI86_27515 [Candidatus Poribacteria bacterium]|nr:hypothetical protein [Candidatus Poribacteria bacterium]
MTFSNLSSQSVVVSWSTTAAVSSRLEYGQTIDLGKTLNSDAHTLLHRIEVASLVPDTQYYFSVVADNTVASGSVKTAKVGAGVPYTLYGKLLANQAALSGALVTVSANNNDQVSSFLTAMSNNDGFWNVNLGNLKDPSSGTVFNHGIGQQLLIQISSPPDVSFHYSQTITGDSPQKIILPELGIVTLDLPSGWNMIGLPGLPVNQDPQALAPDSQTLLQPFYYWSSSGFSYKPVTQLAFGQGYWVLSLNPEGETITLSVELATSYTVSLKAGWNMIGSVSQVVDFSDPADNPDQSILPGTLYEWNSTGFTYRPSTHIEPGRGYWVLTLQDCQLTVGSGVD